MVGTYQIEALEQVVAPGKGSVAYKVGYYTGKAVRWTLTLVGFGD